MKYRDLSRGTEFGLKQVIKMRHSLLFATLLAVVPACGITNMKSVTVHRPADKAIDQTITQMWADEIKQVARDGDWVLTRSYYFVGDVITRFTPGEDLSHASIYSAKTGTVIEAVTPKVREVSLEQLIERNHYVIIVRPSKMTAAERAASVEHARSKVGVAFDTRGMFGFNNKDAWYCSELVYWAAGTARRHGDSQTVITPSEMMKFGEVVYWSGARSDAQVMRAAHAHVVDDDDVARRARQTAKPATVAAGAH
jgi:hypothetical protein